MNFTPETLFDDLKAMLSQKYGQPTSNGASRSDENIAVWKFPTTTIELKCTQGIIGKLMTLRYLQSRPADLDKI